MSGSEQQDEYVDDARSRIREYLVYHGCDDVSSESGSIRSFDYNLDLNSLSDSESMDDYTSDFEINAEDLKADCTALLAHRKTGAEVTIGQPEVRDSEECLISITKPRPHYNLPLPLKTAKKTKFVECAIDEKDWNELGKMILGRDSEGIYYWFQGRKLSRKAQILAEKRINSPLNLAARTGSLAIFEFLLGESFCLGTHFRPMYEAVKHDNIHIVKKLLEIGVDVNSSIDKNSSETPLHVAARNTADSSQMINFLISKGAEIDKIDLNAYTPLHKAVMFGSSENVLALLKAGATVNPELLDCDRPLIHMAVERNVRMVNLIYTAYPQIRIFSGYDEILEAIRCGKVKTLRYFVQKNIPLAPARSQQIQKYDLLLHAASKITRPKVRDLVTDIILGSGYMPSSGTNKIYTLVELFSDKEMETTKKKIFDYFYHPRSLQQVVCFKIRALMGPSLPQGVHLLPVPAVLKNYIQLEHL